ncbi:MAG: sugar phosphate isomerase/epimerase family protein [Isosphaeraceae bacterium]
MRLGYNTNGLAHHRLTDAIDLLADEGYQSVAITLDVGALDPYEEHGVLSRQLAAVRSCLDRRGLARVVETGARYLLNPRLKHDPTLMDADPGRRAIRADFLCRAIDIARALDAECVSLWSGQIWDATPQDQAMDRLADALQPVLRHAELAGMLLAFEPEPGMFIATFARFDQLDRRISHPLFHLTVDLGHVHCIEEGPIADHLLRWAPRILNLHIEDMVRGVHEHLMFGAGTMDFPAVFKALHEINYSRGVHVELSRHSHAAAQAVRTAIQFLRPLLSPRSLRG